MEELILDNSPISSLVPVAGVRALYLKNYPNITSLEPVKGLRELEVEYYDGILSYQPVENCPVLTVME